MVGIEPTTYGLRNRCSTTELHWRSKKGTRINYGLRPTWSIKNSFAQGASRNSPPPNRVKGHSQENAPLRDFFIPVLVAAFPSI